MPFESLEQRKCLGTLAHYPVRNVQLLGNTVLLAPIVNEPWSSGGIFLVDRYQDDRKRWVVLAVGPGYRTKRGVLVTPEVKPGDNVLFNSQLPDGIRHVFEDGSRWTIVDASRLEMVW